MTKAPTKKPTKATGKKISPPVRPAAEHTGDHHVAGGVGPLFERIVSILEEARAEVVRSVNSAMVLAYWQIGREIVEHYQAGAVRAEYGDQLLDFLAAQLQMRVGRGYSATNLKYFRLFYQRYADREPKIRHEPRDESGASQKRHEPSDESTALMAAPGPHSGLEGFSSRLSWTHYRTLTKVAHAAERTFYEIEAERGRWSVPQLERQIHTHLFARLLKSRDKAGVLDLAARGQVLERPVDAIRHPYVLDFLDLPESSTLRESDLESAILEKLQNFLLEIGKGFAFVARQKRLSFEDEHFYVDLVFYNVILKCYLLIDLKLGKLTHQDVGQMDSYVRLFDEQGRSERDGPTIGLILCAEKNEAVARYSVLHENEQLFAAKYLLYLPSVEELERELARERRQLDRRAQEEGGAAPTAVQRGKRQQPGTKSRKDTRAKKKSRSRS
jgi:predicted nuclease of restriction endonuclease-like (RecB) superfamily